MKLNLFSREYTASITISKGQKEAYGWDIKVDGKVADIKKMVEICKEADEYIRLKFLIEPTQEKKEERLVAIPKEE